MHRKKHKHLNDQLIQHTNGWDYILAAIIEAIIIAAAIALAGAQ
jgi:hypothetical protein